MLNNQQSHEEYFIPTISSVSPCLNRNNQRFKQTAQHTRAELDIDINMDTEVIVSNITTHAKLEPPLVLVPTRSSKDIVKDNNLAGLPLLSNNHNKVILTAPMPVLEKRSKSYGKHHVSL